MPNAVVARASSIRVPHGLASAGRALLLVVLAGACDHGTEIPSVPTGPTTVERPTLPRSYRASGHGAAGDVFVHLFEWKWTDIATECERELGPDGYAAVQVSPPQEHSITPNHDWSERYQPVSYAIDRSRSGTKAEFVAMVSRCKAAGVDIYVDAVINHMTNFPSPGVGSNGTSYSKYSYPGLYTSADFHPTCTVTNYASAANVQDCELLGLPDLDTGSESVRRKIASYLVSLARLGVAGFRIDAAKHIQQVELDRIFAITDSTLQAEGRAAPYYFLEISAGGGEALSPRDYFGAGYASGAASDITEFTVVGVQDKLLGVGGQRIAQLDPNGPNGSQFSESAWGLMPSDKAVVFLQNHDTQHQTNNISYRDGQTLRLGYVWLLAQPYGYPSVLSSYAFARPAQNDLGPPSDAQGNTNAVTCAARWETAAVGQWVCEHRDPYVARMVAFRRVTAGTDVNHWWSDGTSAIAFSRGAKGFVAINHEATTLNQTIATGLPAGNYCDRISGGRAGVACAGTSLTVDASGSVKVSLAPETAIAIDIGTKY